MRYDPCGHNDSFFYQLDAQIIYFNTCITFFHMFRALLCINTASGIVNLETSEWSKFQNDDTRYCVNTFVLLKMSTVVLETSRGM